MLLFLNFASANPNELMIYPQNFEQKIGFDEIRSLLAAHCLSPLGVERVEQIQFLTDAQALNELQALVNIRPIPQAFQLMAQIYQAAGQVQAAQQCMDIASQLR